MKAAPLSDEMDWRIASTFERHGLRGTAGFLNVNDLLDRVGPLHASRLPSLIWTLAYRLNLYKISELEAIIMRQDLVLVRGVRGTIHYLSLDAARAMSLASRHSRMPAVYRRLRRSGLNLKSVRRLESEIFDLLLVGSRTASEIVSDIARARSRVAPGTIFAVIRKLWEDGRIVGRPVFRAGRWRISYTFWTDEPPIRLESTQHAVDRVVYNYIRQFSPVSFGDIECWTGIGRTEIKRALHTLLAFAKISSIELKDNILFILNSSDRPSTRDAKCPAVRLLAYEDTTLKGYWQTRWRFADFQTLRKVICKNGEIFPCLTIDGIVRARWQFQSEDVKIEWFMAPKDDEVAFCAKEVARAKEIAFEFRPFTPIPRCRG
jgi:winged helix DNA-binding protein